MNEHETLMIKSQMRIMYGMANNKQIRKEYRADLKEEADEFSIILDKQYREDHKDDPKVEACDMSDLDRMDAEEDGCNCGFKIKKGKAGCGKVIEELVDRDDNGEITDTRWLHCGEGKDLCDECILNLDAIGGKTK